MPATSQATLQEFEQAWDEFFGSLRRARARAAREAGTGELTLSQFHLLAALSERSPLCLGDLAETAGISAPTATRTVDGLERDGIVARRHSESDRRRVEIALTDEGRRIVGRKRRAIETKRKAFFDSLAPGEREQAERILRRLAGLVEEL